MNDRFSLPLPGIVKNGMLLLAFFTLASVALGQPNPGAPGRTGLRTRQLLMYDGQIKILPIPDVARVAVGNGKIVGVTTLPNQIVLIGTGTGTTDMVLWTRMGQVISYHLFITPYDNQQTYDQIHAVLDPIPGLRVDNADGRVVLSGNLNPEEARTVAQIAKTFPGTIDMVRANTVDMKRMVYLDVQVIDFKKSALRDLGIQWQNSMEGPASRVLGDFVGINTFRLGDVYQGGGANTLNGLINGQPGPLTGLPIQVNPFQNYLGLVSSLTSTINLAVQDGTAYILANPQLSTRSGGVASFLAGGEIPIPISSALGETTVLYKKYGVMLKIKPEADRYGNILTNIYTEVSQIDPTVTIDGYPGFLTRKTSTLVNVHSGQTIVLSGLVHSLGASTINKFPWLGDIPILGWLFKSHNFQASRSELVIFVTPVIFNPASRINRTVIRRGVHWVHEFNATEGSGLYMPGFGVGPGTHLRPRPLRSRAMDPHRAAATGSPKSPPATPESHPVMAPPPATHAGTPVTASPPPLAVPPGETGGARPWFSGLF